MQLSGMTMPGYRVYEYLLVLDPHEELRNRIIQLKKDFLSAYKSSPVPKNFSGGRPHLTLANFLQYEMREERLISRLKAIAMGFYPIKVELKDFGSFPTHTIFINVTSKIPVQGLVKRIRSEAQRLMALNEDNKPHFILEPHIPIASRLVPWQYEKGWLEYSQKHFTGRFIADGMILLKRPLDEIQYQVVGRFQFQNLPVVTRQGELFV